MIDEPEPHGQRRCKMLAWRHFQFAWWSLLCFLSLGIALELLHGFKVGWYLEPAFETRRLMWTLGHTHGTLLSLVHIALGATLVLFAQELSKPLRWASPCLFAASFLLAGGFFLGGIFLYSGDPGLGIFLVPLGALSLFAAVLLTALATSRSLRWTPQSSHPPTENKRRKRS